MICSDPSAEMERGLAASSEAAAEDDNDFASVPVKRSKQVKLQALCHDECSTESRETGVTDRRCCFFCFSPPPFFSLFFFAVGSHTMLPPNFPVRVAL